MASDYADYGQKIAEAFQEYLKTGDGDIIEGYTTRELRDAISRLSPYYGRNKQWYRELERRFEQLESQDARIKEKRQGRIEEWKRHWLDKIIAFGLGFLCGVALLGIQLI